MGVKSTRQWPMPAAIWCKTSTCKNTKFACFQHSVNGDWFCLQADGNFRPPPQNPHPLTDHQKIWYRWLFPYGYAKFGANPPIEALGKWVKYNKLKKNCLYPFWQLTDRPNPSVDYHAWWLKQCRLAQGCAFWEFHWYCSPFWGWKPPPPKKKFWWRG